MDDLIAFLRARLDDDEREANSHYELKPDAPGHDLAQRPDYTEVRYHHSGEWEKMTHAEYWERFHVPVPDKRLLAEVDAKRRILDLHDIVWRDIGWLEDGDEEYAEIPVCGQCVPKHSHFSTRADVPEGPCRTVRLLALPLAGHPDYREEWAASDD